MQFFVLSHATVDRSILGDKKDRAGRWGVASLEFSSRIHGDRKGEPCYFTTKLEHCQTTMSIG